MSLPTNNPPADEGAKEALRKAKEILQWAEPLSRDPHFLKFVAIMTRAADNFATKALDVRLSKDERDTFAQRHDAARNLADWIPTQVEECMRRVRAVESGATSTPSVL